MNGAPPKIILASGSAARKTMLANTGLTFETVKPVLDEGPVKIEMQEKNFGNAAIALELSKQKALTVAEQHPEALVIGADQVLELEGRMLTKAKTPQEAKEKLRTLKGKTHKLISAVTVAQGRMVLWSHLAEANLSMHDIDDDFLDSYCADAGEALTRSVGAYEMEGRGAWLFSAVRGDYFTVLGLPLLPLLEYLRTYHKIGL